MGKNNFISNRKQKIETKFTLQSRRIIKKIQKKIVYSKKYEIFRKKFQRSYKLRFQINKIPQLQGECKMKDYENEMASTESLLTHIYLWCQISGQILDDDDQLPFLVEELEIIRSNMINPSPQQTELIDVIQLLDCMDFDNKNYSFQIITKCV